MARAFKNGWNLGRGDRVAHFYSAVTPKFYDQDAENDFARSVCSTRLERFRYFRRALASDLRCAKCYRNPKSRS